MYGIRCLYPKHKTKPVWDLSIGEWLWAQGITGFWGDKKWRYACGEGKAICFKDHNTCITVSHSIPVRQTSLLSLNIARPHSSCLRTLALVLCFLCLKGLLLPSPPSSLWSNGTFSLRPVFFSHPALIEHKLHKERGLLLCFIYHCMPSVSNSIWHIVGAQQIFFEWINDYWYYS